MQELLIFPLVGVLLLIIVIAIIESIIEYKERNDKIKADLEKARLQWVKTRAKAMSKKK